MLKQQEKRGFKQKKLKAKMQTYDEYVSDVASPRPYNTPNVVGKSHQQEKWNTSGREENRDNNPLHFTEDKELSGELLDNVAIRDTKAFDLKSSIRDTNSVGAPISIRDTERDARNDAQRDTKSSDLSSSIRDTNLVGSPISIRDTEQDARNDAQRDTKSSDLSGSIRDTNSVETPISIRDTKQDARNDAQRDTKASDLKSSIRDTNSVETPISIRDTERDARDDAQRDTKASDLRISIRDTNSVETPISIRDTDSAEFNGWRGYPESKVNISSQASVNQRLVRSDYNKNEGFEYLDLTGNAKKIIDEVINNCLIAGELTTPYIKKVDLSINTGVKTGALKTTICRLKDKNVITEYVATKGRNSSWKISLSAEILEQYIQLRKRQ